MKVKVNGNMYDIEVSGNTAVINGMQKSIEIRDGSIKMGGREFVIDFADDARSFMIINSIAYEVSKSGSDRESAREIIAPISGKIIDIADKTDVREGDVLIVLEAMKMENQIKSTVTGRISKINVAKGQSVRTGDILLVFE